MISLIGYMGSGKSTIARHLSEKLQLPLYELDSEIERITLLSIAEIFSRYGEYYFRKIERELLKRLLLYPEGILSLGGGTPCFYDNMKLISVASQSFYLQSTTTDLVNRLSDKKSHRPIIASMAKEELHNFIVNNVNKREAFYRKADYIINNVEIQRSVDEIVDLYHENIH